MLLSQTDLARTAIVKAAEVRDRFGIEPHHAVNIFDLCEEKINPKLTVRFKSISMEGIYLREDREIWLGLRPLTRRVFTCAHELGHCLFRHGSTLDELQSESSEQLFDPDEFLVNTFAAHLLMPRLAVAAAYTVRKWKPDCSTPEQCFVVSSSLGVGYETLATQLIYGLRLVSGSAADVLLKAQLPAIRTEMLGEHAPKRLQVVDKHYTNSVLDTEVGTEILFPKGSCPDLERLIHVASTDNGTLLRVAKAGITRVSTRDGWAILVRAMRNQYVGLSRFRHLEAEDDDDE